jgi:nitrite reductase/ring-hydroxylating ferredoxin subunit
MAKKYKWHKLPVDPADIKWTRGHVADAEFEVAGKHLCLGRLDDEWFAFAASCPHAGAPMTQAYISAAPSTPTNCHISCPVHGLKFNLKNGRDTNGEGYTLKIYPIELRADGLYVGIEEGGGLFKWF